MSTFRTIFIAASLCLLLAACGSGEEGDSTSGNGSGADSGGQIDDDGGITDPDTGAVDAGEQDAGEPDAGEPDAGEQDAGEPDAGEPDAADVPVDAGNDCPGGANCDCSENSDCDNGICLDTADGKKCAQKCVDKCDKGFTCKPFGGSDTTLVCVPDHVSLCAPCEGNQDCKIQGTTSLCIDYGAAGSYCGGACKADDDCPDAYACVDIVDPDTKKLSKQCKLKDPKAVCGCSVWAKAATSKTICSLTTSAGTCKGTRHCAKDGLSACNAPTAVTEVCDGADNDCDGITDGDVCDDDDACTADTCKVKDGKCEHVQLADCNDGDQCNTDSCNPKTGKCEHGAGADCDDKNGCTKDSCDTKTGKCVNALDDGASCDDGDACTDGDKCAQTDGKAGCKPGAAKKCDDGNVCTDDSCDVGKGCVQAPNALTQTCYDGPKDTEGKGTCTAGVKECNGGVLVAECKGAVLPAKTEACDGKDDDCDGQTDEICSATGAELDFATVAGQVAGTKGGARVHIGAESVAGRTKGAKQQVELGLLPWLLGHLLN